MRSRSLLNFFGGGVVFILAMGAATPPARAAVEIAAAGWIIDAGPLGTHVLKYPTLTAGEQTLRPTGEPQVSGDGVAVTYDQGVTLTVTPRESDFRLHFTGLPDSVKKLKLEMSLPTSLGGKASFQIDDGETGTFPKDKPADAFLFKGNGKRLTVAGNDGGGFAVRVEHGWQQLQDNRTWNDNKFVWWASADLPRSNGNEAYYHVEVTGAQDADSVAPAAQPQPRPAADLKLSLDDEGVQVIAGSAGTFALSYPRIDGLDPKEPTEVKTRDAQHATLTYTDGSTAEVLIDAGAVQFAFSGLSSAAKKARFDMNVPYVMAQGGKYAVGNDAPVNFPAEKPEKPFLYQGNADAMTLLHPTGPGFKVAVPQSSYQQLQDNREWGDNKFSWWFAVPLPAGNLSPTLTVRIDPPAGEPTESAAMIDRFGQWINRDFPNKVRSEDELKADLESERAYYDSLNPPATDAFGGFPGTGERFGLKKTGYFHVATVNGAQVLVTPEGNAFFQLGVCCLNPVDEYTLVKGRESIYEWLPKKNDPTFATAWRPNDSGVFSFHLANLIRKTGKPYDEAEYAASWIQRERKWGFNSLGAFSSVDGVWGEQLAAHNYPYVTFLPLSDLEQVPGATKVWDPFADGVEQTIESNFAEKLPARADDPLLIGYFITNEPSVEEVPKVVPKLKASQSPSKRRLTERLREKYGRIAAFNRAWQTDLADFDAVAEAALVVATAEAAADVQAFFAEFLDRRYGLVEKHFRRYDPNHLLIGDRWMPGTSNNEQLVRTAGKYLDVVSINYYAFDPDPSYLSRMHEWSGGRPLLLSEFYFTSPTDSGLTGGMRMDSQQQRGLAYRHYVEHAASLGYIVGIQWFLNMDQAATGRFFQQFNGEANNTGLVDVADRPYKPMLAEMMKTNYDLLPVIIKEREPFRLDDARFRSSSGESRKTVSVHRMTETFELDGIRSEWPGVPSSRVEPQDDPHFAADFRLAWDDRNLYLYIEVADPTPMHNDHPAASIWNGDAVELFVGIDEPDQRGTMIYSDRQVMLRGADAGDRGAVYFANAPRQYEAQSVVVRQVDGKGYIVEAAIPFEALGFEPKVHQELLFDLAIDDSAGDVRFRQLVFNGTRHASKDRGVWGRAQLVP